ncbi:MAG TPA: hypothetical protein VN791_05650 [Acidimicrobiales bacterium]|nr:hypothetical protein [Acidimicrobiales bacterium]
MARPTGAEILVGRVKKWAAGAEDIPMRTGTPVRSEAMIAAATRFKAAWEAGMRRSADGEVLTDRDIVEMHEASLGLIWATGTRDMQEALDVFHALAP